MTHGSPPTLPPVPSLLAHPAAERLLGVFGHDDVAQGCRDILDELRRAIGHGCVVDPATCRADSILAVLEARLGAEADPGMQRVVNATGTVLHVGLGGAPLPQAAVDAMLRAATQFVDFEYDVVHADRARRERMAEDLLTSLTGAEAAIALNSHVAALTLAFRTLAQGKDVIVSRCSLAATGGSCPVREIAAAAGATLTEVGTADRVTADDYLAAISARTAVLLTLHKSPLARSGSEAEDNLPALVSIGRTHGIPVMEDLRHGSFIDLGAYGLPKVPVVAERIGLGADVVTFSAAGIVGGPEAGLVVGGSAWLRQMGLNPLQQALQCGKLTVAALEATLRLYRESACIAQDIPALRVLTRPLAAIEETARRVLPSLTSALGSGFKVTLEDGTSPLSDAGVPTKEIPTKLIVVEHDFMGAYRVAGRFRQARPPIIGRIKDDWFVLDARTILDPLTLVPNWSEGFEGPSPILP